MIKVNYSRDEVVEQCVKIKEIKEDDNKSVRSEMSRALLSLEQEVRRSGRSVRQTMPCNPGTDKVAKISAAKINLPDL